MPVTMTNINVYSYIKYSYNSIFHNNRFMANKGHMFQDIRLKKVSYSRRDL